MRDIDVNFTTQFITRSDSDITTVEDLPGKRFALGGRESPHAGLLPYYFLKEVGIDPTQDLAACAFYEDRLPSALSDERDVVQRVQAGEYDAGAVCGQTLEVMEKEGTLLKDSLRVFWSSRGYSHCCFTAQNDMDQELAQQITQAFLSVDATDPVGKEVLDAEGCGSFVAGITEGWEMLEKAAEEQGLI